MPKILTNVQELAKEEGEESEEKLREAIEILEGATFATDVHEIYTIKYSHIYIFRFTFMLFCN